MNSATAWPEFIDEGLPAQRLESLKDDPDELAQELAFEAYEAETRNRRPRTGRQGPAGWIPTVWTP